MRHPGDRVLSKRAGPVAPLPAYPAAVLIGEQRTHERLDIKAVLPPVFIHVRQSDVAADIGADHRINEERYVSHVHCAVAVYITLYKRAGIREARCVHGPGQAVGTLAVHFGELRALAILQATAPDAAGQSAILSLKSRLSAAPRGSRSTIR